MYQGIVNQLLLEHVVYWTCNLLCSATDLIKQLLTTDAQKRLTAAQALEHPWIKSAGKANKGTLTLTRRNLAKHVGARVKVSNLQRRNPFFALLSVDISSKDFCHSA